jgi:hypothetical protein
MERTTGLDSELEKEAPNVVKEILFRHLVATGYMAEIVCQEAAFRKASVWYGEWIVRVVNLERSYQKILVTSPRRQGDMGEIKVRVFKTINGLTSFMHDVGFAHLDIPLILGGRSLQMLPDEAVAKSDSK